MSLLSFLGGKAGKSAQAASAAGQRAPASGRPPQGALRVGASASEPTALRPRSHRQVSPPPVYRSLSDLPAHTGIASQPGGRFELSAEKRQHLFILQLEHTDNAFCVVTTKEHFGSATYKAAVGLIHEAGGKVLHAGTADAALIQSVSRDSRNDPAQDADVKPIVRDIEKLAQAALDMDVSDIHIESRRGKALVRMRVHGVLSKYSDSWSSEYVERMARALYTTADNDSKAPTYTDDAQFSVSRTLPSGARVKLRVQLSPAYPDEGLDIVVRVLRVAVSAKVKSLEALGYAADHIAMLEYAQASPHGLITVAGVTGSGKTTTLQTMMQNIRKADAGRKLISIEDPPEYVQDGVTQIPVARRNDGEDPFAAAMRNTMRMDPDVVMVGEIRDSVSANLLVAMVQSGHKVLTTIHTESAINILGRLRGMGVDSDILASRGFIAGLVFQTLVPTLCRHCRRDYDPGMEDVPAALHERIRHVIKEGDTVFVESAAGCRHCNSTGIAGRTVCAEIVIPDATLRDHILANDMKSAYSHWRAQRRGKSPESMIGATALEHAILKMRRGEVSPAAVEGALGLLYDFTQEADLMREAAALLDLGT